MRPQSTRRPLPAASSASAPLSPPRRDRPAWSQRHNTVSFEEGEEGWYPLFDGKTLDGWIVPEGADWQARDGEIVVETGANNLLIYDETFSDFELKVDFLAAPSANSGIFVRVTGKSARPRAPRHTR